MLAGHRAKAAAALPYLNKVLWNETHQYFRAWQDAKLGAPPWVMADTLYGQVSWPNTFLCGHTVPVC